MSQIAIFNFGNHHVRVINDDRENPWFNASDICDALELVNHRQSIETHVDDEDIKKIEVVDSLGRKQLTNHVNESGMYALIFGSKKAEAKAFKRWVTSEVLPSIRKTGGYTLPDHEAKLLAMYERGKTDLSLRMTKQQCEYGIARLTGDKATVTKIEREMKKEQHWRENTAEGWADTFFKEVGPGWADNVDTPSHIPAAEVIAWAKKHFKKKGIKLEIEQYGPNKFWFETLH